MDMLYALLLSQPIAHDKDQALPKWLPALLLAMESLLVTAEEPRAVPRVLADQPVVIPPLVVGPPYTEARSMLFELCIRLLHIRVFHEMNYSLRCGCSYGLPEIEIWPISSFDVTEYLYSSST